MLAHVDMMQTLTSVEQFYNNAFGHLVDVLFVCLMILGVIIAAVGFGYPYLRSRSLMKEYKDALEERMKKASRRLNHHSAMHWYATAQTSLEAGSWGLAVHFLCYAIQCAIAAEGEVAENRWQALADALQQLQEVKTQYGGTQRGSILQPLVETISLLQERPKLERYTRLISILETLRAEEEAGQT